MKEVLAFATLFLEGLLAGVFVCSGLVEHAMRKLAGPSWIVYKQAKENLFGPVMPPFFGIGVLAAVASAIVFPRPALIAAAALMVVTLAITVTVHLPMNGKIQAWSPTSLTDDWDATRARWRDWNWVRTAPVVAAFALSLRG